MHFGCRARDLALHFRRWKGSRRLARRVLSSPSADHAKDDLVIHPARMIRRRLPRIEQHRLFAQLFPGLRHSLVDGLREIRFDSHLITLHYSITPRERTFTSVGSSLCDSTVRLGIDDSTICRKKYRDPALVITTAASAFA